MFRGIGRKIRSTYWQTLNGYEVHFSTSLRMNSECECQVGHFLVSRTGAVGCTKRQDKEPLILDCYDTISHSSRGYDVVTSRTVDMVASKANTWVWLEQSYVQILVVVATIQMRTLKTDVEKGSMWTAIGHGSVSPKMRSKEGSERGIFTFWYSIKSKGKQVNILVLSVGDCLISCQTYVVTQSSSDT